MSAPSRLSRLARVLLSATVLGGLLAAGLPVAASAAPQATHTLTVTVRNVTGTPIPGLTVLAIPVADGTVIAGDRAADGSYKKAKAVKGKIGVYSFASLGDFDHTLYFGTATSTTFAQLLGGVSDIDRAQVVPSGQSTISVSLATNAVITGVVKNPAGKVLAKTLVTAYYSNGTDWLRYSSALTDSKGKYTLKDIDPGSYRLSFRTVGRDYPILYSGNAPRLEAATAFVVGVGTTTTANATFSAIGGGIKGSARVEYEDYEDYGDYPLAGTRVVAYPVISEGNWSTPKVVDFDHGVASATTGKSGAFAIKNLAAGKYVVALSPGYYNQSLRYYGGPGLSNAIIVTVDAGSVTKIGHIVSRQTYRGGSITITVKDNLGAAVPGADVLLQSTSETDYYYRALTNSKGVVSFGKSGKAHTIQPGDFDIVVSTNGVFAPKWQPVPINDGPNVETISLAPPAQPAGFVAAPSIAQTGLIVGTKYTVVAQAKRTTSTLGYQWLRDGRPIYGADAATYQSRAADAGTVLSVRVSSSQEGYATDYATATVAGAVVSDESVPTNVTPPRVTSSAGAWVGTTLHLMPGTWSVPGLDFDYTWKRDGIPFEHEGATYVVQLSDLGAEITGSVVTKKQGHPDATADTISGVTPVFGPATELQAGLTVTATTKGVPKKTTRYTVTPGTWTALDPTFSYEWLRGGLVVGTGPTFTEKPAAADLAFPVDVRVSAVADGFLDGTAELQVRAASAVLKSSVAPTVSLAGDLTPFTPTSPVEYQQSVTASTGTWAHGVDEVGSLKYSYQWFRKVGKAKAASIEGATRATYAPKIADIGAVLSVKVTASSSRWAAASVTVPAGVVTASSKLTDIAPSIGFVRGARSVGEPLDGYVSDTWDNAGVKTGLQWYGCALPACTPSSPLSSFSKIAKATSWSYIPSKTYANGRIYFAATGTKTGYKTTTVKSAVLDIAVKGTVTEIRRAAVEADDGEVKVGDNVFFTRPEFSYSYYEFTPSWQVCSSDCLSPTAVWTPAVGSATTYSFSASGDNLVAGVTHLRVSVFASFGGNEGSTSISEPVRLVKNDLAEAGGKNVTVLNSGTTTSIQRDYYFPRYATISQRWFVEGEERSTAATYTRDSADLGKGTYVWITVSAPGYDDIEFMRRVYNATPTFVAAPFTIVGTTFGDTLTLSDPEPFKNLPQFEGANWTYSYSWDSSHRPDAINSTYVVPASSVGRKVRVEVTVSSPIYGSFTKLVTMTTNVLPGAPLTSTGDATIAFTGDLLPGTTATAVDPEYSATPVTSTFVWQTSTDGGTTWATETGATARTFTPGLIHADRMLRVTVTGTRLGNGTTTSTSAPVHILEGDVIRVLGNPVLSGGARVDSTMTATMGSWAADVTPSRQWLLNGRAIPGATGPSYTPLPRNAGDEISVRVTGRQAGKLDVTAESAAFTIDRAAAPKPVKPPVISGKATLAVTPGVWNVSGLTFSHQWRVDGAAVEGATSDTFALPAGVAKTRVSVVITTERFGYEAAEVVVGG